MLQEKNHTFQYTFSLDQMSLSDVEESYVRREMNELGS